MTNNKQQTAVDFLCEKLAAKLGVPNAISFYVDHQEEIREAKERERELMIEFGARCIQRQNKHTEATMKDKQQTSVEWYAIEMAEYLRSMYGEGIINLDILKRAKEKHRQEIVNAVDGYPIANRYLDGNEYYEQTYGGNK